MVYGTLRLENITLGVRKTIMNMKNLEIELKLYYWLAISTTKENGDERVSS